MVIKTAAVKGVESAVGDVEETLFSHHLLLTEGIKCPLVGLAWFRLGSAPQCCTKRGLTAACSKVLQAAIGRLRSKYNFPILRKLSDKLCGLLLTH